MHPSYEMFDHTADLGVRVRAASLAELIKPASDALFAAIGEMAMAGPGEPRRIEAAGDDQAVMLRDYLAEALYLFECEASRFFPKRIEEFSERKLVVEGLLVPLDVQRCAYYREVKAVTYHELAIREIEGGFEAVFIVDI